MKFYFFRNSIFEFGAAWAHVREGGQGRSRRPWSSLREAAIHQSQDLWHPRIQRHEFRVSTNMYVLSRLTGDICAKLRLRLGDRWAKWYTLSECPDHASRYFCVIFFAWYASLFSASGLTTTRWSRNQWRPNSSLKQTTSWRDRCLCYLSRGKANVSSHWVSQWFIGVF
jgi:hypothetical protein